MGKEWTQTTDVDLLLDIPTEVLGLRHYPINHGEVVSRFEAMIADIGMEPIERIGQLSPDNRNYIYQCKFQHSWFSFTLGFINYNDKKKSFQGLAGEEVFVCTNGMVKGAITESVRKHTTNVMDVLDDKIQATIGYFQSFIETRETQIMERSELTIHRDVVGELIMQSFDAGISPSTVGQVYQEFQEPSFEYPFNQQSLYGWQNAATHVFKKFNPLYRVEMTQLLDGVIDNMADQLMVA